MAQQFAFKHSSVTKLLLAEASRTTHALQKDEGQYVAQEYLSPTGRTIGKAIVCGTATEVEDVGTEGGSFWRLRIADPSGSIGVMAGTYQPEAMQAITQLEIPCYVAVVGKLNVYEPESGSQIVSIRPDAVIVIDKKTRDDFVLDTALSTIRSIRSISDEKMKEVTEIYGEKDGRDTYISIAQQALESLQEVQEEITPPAPAKVDEKPEHAKASAPGKDKKEKKDLKKKEEPEKEKSKIGKEIDDSIKSVQDVVMQILQEEVQFKYEDLPEMLKKKGVNPLMQDWESAVKRLKKSGYCCEPKPGLIRVV